MHKEPNNQMVYDNIYPLYRQDSGFTCVNDTKKKNTYICVCIRIIFFLQVGPINYDKTISGMINLE